MLGQWLLYKLQYTLHKTNFNEILTSIDGCISIEASLYNTIYFILEGSMGAGIQQQISEIHQRVKEFVEKQYKGYRVFSVRNCAATFYAEETASIIDMSVEAAKGDNSLHCLVSVNDDTISIVSAKESPCSRYD